LRLQAKPVDGAEHEVQLPGWPDANDALWLVAPAIEQLALIAENGLHGISFRYGFKKLACGAEAVSRQGPPSLRFDAPAFAAR